MSSTPNGGFKSLDLRLEGLVTEARRFSPLTEERQSVIAELVKEILRSRKIGCPYKGQPLFGVHQEIYEKVQQQLWDDVSQEIDQYNPQQTSVREWTNALRNHAFKKILDHALLKKLALTAQSHPPHSGLRHHALGELIEAIRLSGRLCRPHREKFAPDFYELLYEEAVIETWTYVCKNIDKYDPERGDKKFMNWVNFRLDKLVIECRRKFSNLNIKDLPTIDDLDDLDNIAQAQEPPSLSEIVRKCVEEDAENLFKQAHIRNRQDANFQVIMLARLSGKSWEEISANFGIPVQTLSSLFQRCCDKFTPNFRNYVQG